MSLTAVSSADPSVGSPVGLSDSSPSSSSSVYHCQHHSVGWTPGSPPPWCAYHCQYCSVGWLLVSPPPLCTHHTPFPPLVVPAPLPPPHHGGQLWHRTPQWGAQAQAPSGAPQIDPSESSGESGRVILLSSWADESSMGDKSLTVPMYWYPLCAIGGWVISKDISLKHQTVCHSHKFTAGFSHAESQMGQSTPKVYCAAKDIAKVVALAGHTRLSQGNWEYQFIPHFLGWHALHQVI